MKADPELMRRVLANLIDNAAEAMEGSPVRQLRVATRVESDGDAVEIEVSDSGHGISPEDKLKLFLPHFSTKDRGTGLGLAIASRIIAEHNGTIRVEDNFPVGSALRDSLPCRRSRPQPRDAEAPWRVRPSAVMRLNARVHPHCRRRRAASANRWARCCATKATKWTAVASGEECLERLERRSFDLVLLDVWLQEIDGLETLARMQSRDGAPMVVMISGHGNIETAVRATKLGAFDFVEKPLSLEKIVLVVRNALEYTAARRRKPPAARGAGRTARNSGRTACR